MCAKHLRKILHKNVVVQKELAPSLWSTHFLFAPTHSLTGIFKHIYGHTVWQPFTFSASANSYPFTTLVWSTVCSEGQTRVLAQDHLGRKSQDPDALAIIYKREGHESLIPQNRYSVRDGVTRGGLSWGSLTCWARQGTLLLESKGSVILK